MSGSVRLLLILSLFTGARLNAVTLDWSAVSWTDGSLSNSYDIDPSSPGNDITVTISGSTNKLVADTVIAGNPQTPAITSGFQGGLGSIPKTLDLALDLNNLSQSVAVTVTFSAGYAQGVKNVSFQIFDIDFQNSGSSTYQDELRSITATTITNTTIGATVTGSANNSVTGSGTSIVVDGTASTADTGATSGLGNVTINFGSTAIKSFTFAYGSGPDPGASNPTFQHIGIYNVGYTPVPEMNPSLASAFSCVAALLLAFWHHARVRKKRL